MRTDSSAYNFVRRDLMREKKTDEKEPKIYCCFANNETGIEQVLGLAFKDYVENQAKIKKVM